MATPLNRMLRNAIGHSSVTHDLATGHVTGPKYSVRYTDYVAQTSLGLQIVLLRLNAVKLLLIRRIDSRRSP